METYHQKVFLSRLNSSAFLIYFQASTFFVMIICLSNFFQGKYDKMMTSIRSSYRRCSIKNGVLKNFTKFTGKHLCQSLFFNKVADLRPATLLKRRLYHRYFPVNFVKFFKAPFLQNTSG